MHYSGLAPTGPQLTPNLGLTWAGAQLSSGETLVNRSCLGLDWEPGERETLIKFSSAAWATRTQKLGDFVAGMTWSS